MSNGFANKKEQEDKQALTVNKEIRKNESSVMTTRLNSRANLVGLNENRKNEPRIR